MQTVGGYGSILIARLTNRLTRVSLFFLSFLHAGSEIPSIIFTARTDLGRKKESLARSSSSSSPHSLPVSRLLLPVARRAGLLLLRAAARRRAVRGRGGGEPGAVGAVRGGRLGRAAVAAHAGVAAALDDAGGGVGAARAGRSAGSIIGGEGWLSGTVKTSNGRESRRLRRGCLVGGVEKSIMLIVAHSYSC